MQPVMNERSRHPSVFQHPQATIGVGLVLVGLGANAVWLLLCADGAIKLVEWLMG